MRLDATIAGGIRNSCLVALVALVSGCQPAPSPLPVTGEISLKLVGSPRPEVSFKLTNQSSRVVSFRGSRVKGGAHPWDAWMECLETATNEWTEGPYALVDGGAGDVAVGVGEQLDVVLGFDHHEKFCADYKGGRCRFKLKLLDDTVVTSDEFQPQ